MKLLFLQLSRGERLRSPYKSRDKADIAIPLKTSQQAFFFLPRNGKEEHYVISAKLISSGSVCCRFLPYIFYFPPLSR